MAVNEFNILNRQYSGVRVYLKGVYNLGYGLIVTILFFSGLSKMINPLPSFDAAKSVLGLPDNINIILITIIPILELVLGGLLCLKVKQNLILTAVSFLFICFLLFVIYGYMIGVKENCGCFGDLTESNFDLSMIFRNSLLVILSLGVLVYSKKFKKFGNI